MKKVAARWREFGGAAFMAFTFVFLGAPLLPMVAGIALVGLWNLYAYRRDQAALHRS